jgi:hypothetical protein
MHALRLAILLICALVEGGCGLPDQYYLAPPNLQTLAGGTGSTFSFSNPDHALDSTNVSFKGFELYYRLYASDNAIAITGQDYSASNPAAPEVQLIANGFFPVCASTDVPPGRNLPLIPVTMSNQAYSFTVTITINQYPAGALSTAAYTVGASPINVEIRRNAQDQTLGVSAYKTFLPNSLTIGDPSFVPTTDADIAPIWTKVQSLGGSAYLAMYALSYGLQGISTTIRSTPTFLGYISLSIN